MQLPYVVAPKKINLAGVEQLLVVQYVRLVRSGDVAVSTRTLTK